MRNSQPFHISRRRLAAWYTGVMTLILMAGSYAIYRLVIHARWLYLERDMQQLALVLEHQLQPILEQPGQLAAMAQERLPGLCITALPCPVPSGPEPEPLENDLQAKLNILPSPASDAYCIRLIDLADEPVATLNLPSHNDACNAPEFWKRLRDQQGERYHQKRYPLHTVSLGDWGTLQVARSLNALDMYLLGIELILLLLLLFSIFLVGYASWWLAGMALQPVRQSYNQMQQFTADAAHELRTPLAAIRAMVQTALRSSELSPEEVNTTLQTVDRQSQRLSRLVQDLLVLSQMEQDVGPASRKVCELNTLVKDLVVEFKAMADTAQVQLELEFQTAVPVYVLGQADQLHRAVANVLSNAIQYTPTGGQVTVVLASEATHEAIIQVRDTGVGISPEAQARIFDRFYRVEKERSRHSGGSGLGLAIVQAIVNAHHGTIEVQSTLGQGSTFILRLPFLTVL